jgi:hypothetical protein
MLERIINNMNNYMNKKLSTTSSRMLATAGASIALLAVFATTASADMINVHAGATLGVPPLQVRGDTDASGNTNHPMMMPGVFGTVTAISGNTITVQRKAFEKPGTSTTTAATTYTVDATNATVTKNKAASSVSAIAVGDTIIAQGTLTGTNLVATKIEDGMMFKGQPGSNGGVVLPQGNGQPIVGGKVTAVSGNTVTITNSSNVAYTIDVTNAKITKNGTASTVSTVAVGDTVLAQGTVNGTSVTAVSLTDSAAATNNGSTGQHTGFFGAIGGFFSKLFGF